MSWPSPCGGTLRSGPGPASPRDGVAASDAPSLPSLWAEHDAWWAKYHAFDAMRALRAERRLEAIRAEAAAAWWWVQTCRKVLHALADHCARQSASTRTLVALSRRMRARRCVRVWRDAARESAARTAVEAMAAEQRAACAWRRWRFAFAVVRSRHVAQWVAVRRQRRSVRRWVAFAVTRQQAREAEEVAAAQCAFWARLRLVGRWRRIAPRYCEILARERRSQRDAFLAWRRQMQESQLNSAVATSAFRMHVLRRLLTVWHRVAVRDGAPRRRAHAIVSRLHGKRLLERAFHGWRAVVNRAQNRAVQALREGRLADVSRTPSGVATVTTGVRGGGGTGAARGAAWAPSASAPVTGGDTETGQGRSRPAQRLAARFDGASSVRQQARAEIRRRLALLHHAQSVVRSQPEAAWAGSAGPAHASTGSRGQAAPRPGRTQHARSAVGGGTGRDSAVRDAASARVKLATPAPSGRGQGLSLTELASSGVGK